MMYLSIFKHILKAEKERQNIMIQIVKNLNNIVNEETTLIKENKGVPYITFNKLNDIEWLTNAFSTRIGGVSEGIYSSMNLSFTLNDDSEKVLDNFKIFANAIGVDVKDMVYSQQTHTINVKKITKDNKGMGIVRERDYKDIDGIITNEPGICLVTSYADCVPLYFVDIKNKAIGLSHSGWRGTVGNIAANTLQLMKKEYGTKEEDVIAIIGPSICKDCYEVSKDLYDEFEKKYSQDELRDIFERKNDEKYQLDLWKANYYNFVNLGIKKENISVTDICTCCNKEIMFSHRGSHGKRGTLCAFLMIKESK